MKSFKHTYIQSNQHISNGMMVHYIYHMRERNARSFGSAGFLSRSSNLISVKKLARVLKLASNFWTIRRCSVTILISIMIGQRKNRHNDITTKSIYVLCGPYPQPKSLMWIGYQRARSSVPLVGDCPCPPAGQSCHRWNSSWSWGPPWTSPGPEQPGQTLVDGVETNVFKAIGFVARACGGPEKYTVHHP